MSTVFMSPPVKANWLVDLMTVHDFMDRQWAIKCALICVNEVIEAIDDVTVGMYNYPYWEQVKEEIKKL